MYNLKSLEIGVLREGDRGETERRVIRKLTDDQLLVCVFYLLRKKNHLTHYAGPRG